MLRRAIEYTYVLTSPPDYDEIGLDPDRQQAQYRTFLRETLCLMKPTSAIATLVTTDRKSGGIVHQKHVEITNIMRALNYRLVAQKVWMKSQKANLYRLNYAFVLTFARVERLPRAIAKKHAALPDVLTYAPEVISITASEPYHNAFPLALARTLIDTYTLSGDVVYDPFVGSGTTLVAALQSKRTAIGSEIDKTLARVAERRAQEATT